MQQPHTVKLVQSFLGLVNYYRKFIKDCSIIARPLYNLTTKGAEFDWTNECQAAFEHFKYCLTSTDCVLVLPNFEKPFILETDACQDGIGAILAQEVEGFNRPVCYFNRTLNKAERNYCTSEQ